MESRDKLPRQEYENVRIVSDGGEATARYTLPRHEYENVRMNSDGGDSIGKRHTTKAGWGGHSKRYATKARV